jgi:hypothetical protein
MKNYTVEGHSEQVYYPAANFDYETGVCELSGESYMEETYKFYEPMIHWLQTYTTEKNTIVFNFKLTYFNTSSSRFILQILNILRQHQEQGGKVEINWYYKKDDPDILSEIADFKTEAGVDITIYPMSDMK